MAAPITLPDDVASQVERLAPLDFVVGVITQNNAETIGGVVQAAWAGLERAFPGARMAVLHADVGSRDGTPARARDAMPQGPLVQVRLGVDRAPGLSPAPVARADALRAIFSIADRLGVRGCALLEATLTNVTPDRVARLLGPLVAGTADFVAPHYARHRFVGALTTGIVYPFIRALYGKRIRFPIAGEFACSARVIQRCLATGIWRADAAPLAIEVGLTVQALTGGFGLTQVSLSEKTHAGGEGLDLTGTLSRVLGSLFLETERTVAVWQKVRGSTAVPLSPPDGTPGAAQPGAIDQHRALDAFRLGAYNLQDIWSPVLPPLARLELQKLARLDDAAFRFPDALWVRIVYDFALAYHMRVMNRDHLLSAFTPLYSGWLGSWVGELDTATAQDVEARVEQLCLQYESQKPYFISGWRSPDRFNP